MKYKLLNKFTNEVWTIVCASLEELIDNHISLSGYKPTDYLIERIR